MKLEELGERAIIEIFLKEIGGNILYEDSSLIDLGDSYMVISTDIINERLHIPREMTPYQIGKYLVNVNLSDIASMGAKPIGFLAAFGLRKDLDENFVKEIAKGIRDVCKKYDVKFLGGDTKESSEINIAGIAIGIVEKDKVLLRSKARVGDLICVTGKLGSAAMGYHCLIRGIYIEKFVKKALEPEARIREGMILKDYANACIDISDGLAYSLGEISRRSNVGFIIYEDKIPYDKDIIDLCEKFKIDFRDVLYYKGGDYELLFTIDRDKVEELRDKIEFYVIGEIKEKGFGRKIFINGKVKEFEVNGWESFKSRI